MKALVVRNPEKRYGIICFDTSWYLYDTLRHSIPLGHHGEGYDRIVAAGIAEKYNLSESVCKNQTLMTA